jgi:hypothetical protein
MARRPQRIRFMPRGRRWIAPLALALALSPAARAGECTTRSPAQTLALVELYTSQGCSSCPPADRWLSELREPVLLRAIPLSLHVGYWDYIGWKDPFALRVTTERQRALAAAGGSSGIYTPEVFVSGSELREWRTPGRFEARLSEIQGRSSPVRIEVSARVAPDAVAVDVAVGAAGETPTDAELFVVLKQHGLSTAVDAGENEGRQLANDHVVRHWAGPLPAHGTQSARLPLPADGPRRFETVAFVASRARGTVLQAVALPLDRCEPRPADERPAPRLPQRGDL